MKHACLSALAGLLISAAGFTQSPSRFVDPFIGTGQSNVTGESVPGGKGGATQPAAVVPFGMVQLGPDTDKPETSGYNFANKSIKAFSLTHMSGPGCRNSGEVAFMPVTGNGSWPQPTDNTFIKANESASPGYYQVRFDSGTAVELTATERTGMVKFGFAESDSVGVVFNTGINGSFKTTGDIIFTGPRSLRGEVKGGGFCNSRGNYMVYFAVKFDRDFTATDFTNNIAKVSFAPSAKPLLMKVGISYVSQENAELNLNAENPGFDFEGVRNLATAKWDKALSTVIVNSPQKKIFYTALYHSLLHPNLGSDVDGSYMGMDFKIHQSARPYYVNFSGWDIYRSQVQLLAFLFPKRASDIAQSLVTAGNQCGVLPKWANNNIETDIMSGDPGSLILANMSAFGAEDFDHESALALMKKSALDPSASCQGHVSRWGLADFINKGFIPEPTANGNWSSASIVLEYANADFGVGNYAYDHGDKNFAAAMAGRSTYWRKLWDPGTALVRPMTVSGKWLDGFTASSRKGFMEGNSAQYTWMVPHDLSTLISVMGGDAVASKRLDDFLSQTNAGQGAPYLYLGNEPSFGVPWIYLWAHNPALTQKHVRKLLAEEFKDGPGGLTGNDDLGALSSWYVWGALGMFPAVPGVSGVVIGSPAFSDIVITPEGRSPIHVVAPDAEKSIYVQSLKLGEKKWDRTWVTLKTLRDAGQMTFRMSAEPSDWGSAEGNEPPSLMQGKPIEWPIGQD